MLFVPGSKHDLTLINYGTGCIFEYNATHAEGSGIGFKEEDIPNFFGSYYSRTKAIVSGVLTFFGVNLEVGVGYDMLRGLSNGRVIVNLVPDGVRLALHRYWFPNMFSFVKDLISFGQSNHLFHSLVQIALTSSNVRAWRRELYIHLLYEISMNSKDTERRAGGFSVPQKLTPYPQLFFFKVQGWRLCSLPGSQILMDWSD